MDASTEAGRQADPRYAYTVHLADVGWDEARKRTVAALAEEGFGVLTEIDVKATLKKKLDVDFRRYAILGACNPGLAHRGLQAETALGLLLPCNVAIWEEAGGTAVSMLRPDMMFLVASNPALEPIAREADERLRRVARKLAG